MRVSQFKAALDALHASDQLIHLDLMPGGGFVAQDDFALDQRHGAFQSGHAVFKAGDIFGDLIDPVTDVPQVLKDQVI